MKTWQLKVMRYCSTIYADSQAVEDAASIRDIMYAFKEDHIVAKIKKKLQEAKKSKALRGNFC